MNYKIGTRASKLALIQTELVCEEILLKNPHLSPSQFEIVKIKTIGDKILNKDLNEIGGKNLFIKEIEEALLSKKIDFAVHSLKDMTANVNPKLVIAACLEREDPRDALISPQYKTLSELPKNSLIGTSSVRRKSIALHYRPDIKCISFRGNVLTRLEKLEQKQVDASFLAVAGLKRLSIDESLYHPLDIEEFLPAVSQGIIGVECRKDNHDVYQLLRGINHNDTEICNIAERAFLEYLEADCSAPIAAYAELSDSKINLNSLVIDSKGEIHKFNIQGSINEAYDLGYQSGVKLKPFLLS